MQEPSNEWRQCPTRSDGVEVLIEHRIHGTTCQERQRKLYHKCFSCVHRGGAHVPGAGALPPLARPASQEVTVVPVAPRPAGPSREERPAKAPGRARQAG